MSWDFGTPDLSRKAFAVLRCVESRKLNVLFLLQSHIYFLISHSAQLPALINVLWDILSFAIFSYASLSYCCLPVKSEINAKHLASGTVYIIT